MLKVPVQLSLYITLNARVESTPVCAGSLCGAVGICGARVIGRKAHEQLGIALMNTQDLPRLSNKILELSDMHLRNETTDEHKNQTKFLNGFHWCWFPLLQSNVKLGEKR